MKYAEALEIIKDRIPVRSGVIEEALDLIEKCVNKQIPTKGIMIGDEYSSVLSCPSCNKPIVNVWNSNEYKPNYCHYCGQVLDWSDTE